MIEALRTVSEKIDETLSRYESARARVDMVTSKIEDDYSYWPENKDQKKLAEAATIAGEWHDIVYKTQTFLGTSLILSSTFTKNRLLKGANLAGGLLLLAAAKGSLVRREQMQKTAEQAQNEYLNSPTEEDLSHTRLKLL